MKQKYALSIADFQLSVITEADQATVEKIAGMLDRRMREIYLKSRRCSKNEAALLCALDFCADKLDSAVRTAELEEQIARLNDILDKSRDQLAQIEQENKRLEHENALLKALVTEKTSAGGQEPVSVSDFLQQVALAEASAGSDVDGRHADTTLTGDGQAADPVAGNGASGNDRTDAEAGAQPGKNGPRTKGRSRVGSMFDLLSFDEV